MKYCYKCKKEKDETEFHKNRSKKDGLCCECKACKKIIKAISYEQNKEKISIKHKKYIQ